VRFNPNVSIALGLDADWTLQSFDISEASLSLPGPTNLGVESASERPVPIAMLMNAFFL